MKATGVFQRNAGIWLLLPILFLLTACGREEGEALDAALLKGERVAGVYTLMPQYPESAVNAYSPSKMDSLAAEAQALREIIARRFDVQRMEAALLTDLAALPSPPVAASDYLAAIEAFIKAMDKINQENVENLEQTQRSLKTSLESRTDRPVLEHLAQAMALPEIGGEQALVARRMVEIIRLGVVKEKEQLRAMREAERVQLVDQIMETTRQQPEDEQIPPFQSPLAIEGLRRFSTATLTRLAPHELETLKKFYLSAEGRKKSQTLVSAFKRQIDADSRLMLLDYLDYLRK
ncbi:hypothetical protein GE253_09775 [Niveispirillum sp. SYP-B3756]|uniref:hypothetical protein n=1 Tax=Niveispirillum sp. SYP-B3756 TaxID=2662178 RepID=UPI001291A503|nr:hypothetical protein [Niveispirillum sp. SYP-B3756]MQP65627.1 hypothetical protein [Niveispirillum sp. SYP-B3756]